MTQELPTPTAETLRRAKLFWEQGTLDMKGARAALRGGEFVQSSYLSLQGAMNALSALCHLHGHFKLPMGGPGQLLALFAGGAPEEAARIGALEALEQVTERNPFADSTPSDDLSAQSRACLEEGERLLKALAAYLKAHRKVYFAP